MLQYMHVRFLIYFSSNRHLLWSPRVVATTFLKIMVFQADLGRIQRL